MLTEATPPTRVESALPAPHARIMLDTVISSNNKPLRDLFWQLDNAGPWLLTGLLLLLLIADWRRTAMVALAFSALCGLATAVVLHVNYVMPIWRTHESAI